MKPQASPRKMRKVSGDGVSMRSTNWNSALPMASRLPQRCRLATTSSLVTGLPSWNSRPLRSLKVHRRLSGLSVQLSTICGLIWAFSSVPNRVS
jgi:hypothetical protein